MFIMLAQLTSLAQPSVLKLRKIFPFYRQPCGKLPLYMENY